MEAKSTGLYYSWSNSSISEDSILSRIDKAFVNQAWLGEYADVYVNYLSPGVSYHSPLLLFDINMETREAGRPFRFLMPWLTMLISRVLFLMLGNLLGIL